MNLQPRWHRRVSTPMAAALALSALLHLCLLWPSPPVRPAAARPVATVGFLRPQPAAVASRPESRGSGTRAVPRSPLRDVDAQARVLQPVGALPPPALQAGVPVAPSDGALRALRFALARGVAASGADVRAPGASITLEVRLLMRRVVGIGVVRASADPGFDRKVLAAFKAAALDAVIPDSLPPDGFTVELEVEGGEHERPNDGDPHAPG